MKKSILFSIVLMLAAGIFFTACGPTTNPETKKAAEAVVAEMNKYVDDYNKIQIDPANPQMQQVVADKEKGWDAVAKKWDDAKFTKEIKKDELDVIAKGKKDAEDKWKKATADMKTKLQAAAQAPAPEAAPADKPADKPAEAKK